MRDLLLGSSARVGRRLGGQLMPSAAAHADNLNAGRLRAAMAGPPSDFIPPAHLLEIHDAWRRVQVRQLFGSRSRRCSIGRSSILMGRPVPSTRS